MKWDRHGLGQGLCLLFLLGVGLLLVFWPERVGRSHVVAATLLGLGAVVLGRWIGVGRARLVAVLVLCPIVAAAGAYGWHYRQYLERRESPWPQFHLEASSGAALRLQDPSPGGEAPGAAGGSGGSERASDARRATIDHLRSRAVKDVRSLPPPPGVNMDRYADEILEGTFRFYGTPPLRVQGDLTWKENPHGDRTWVWCLHTMNFIEPLTLRYQATGNLAYLQKAEDLVLDWIADNHLYVVGPASALAWHDHVTAIRLRGWLPFWEVWTKSSLHDDAEVEIVLETIIAHGRKLADPEFYSPVHNHGIEQDIALMALALTLPELKESSAWLELARRRLAEQVRDTVSREGVHLEHSPGYHVFTLGVLRRATDLARRFGVVLEPADLPVILERMARAAAYFLRPDGKLTRVGDTLPAGPLGPEDPILGSYAETDPVLRFALTRGQEGTPGECAVFFPEAGYAIFRDSWGTAETFGQALHLFFTAAAHPERAHKQSDDLSFTLFARGRELLVDAGYHSSHTDEPGRQYALHSRAHNLVLVDGEGCQGFTVRMEGQFADDRVAVVQASHENYPTVRHRRLLAFVRPATILVVDDIEPKGTVPGSAEGTSDLPAPGAHELQQLFHLAPELAVTVADEGSTILAHAADDPAARPLLRIRQLAGGRRSASVVRGMADPLQGWVSRAHRELEPAPVAVYRERGEGARFVTIIEVLGGALPREGEASAVIGADGTVALSVPGAGTTTIRRSGTGIAVERGTQE